MDALTGAVLAAVAKAIASKVGGELAGSAVQGVKKRAFGDPERKALERALQRAYDRVVAGHGRVLVDYDVNPGFLQFEAAGELAKALVPGVQPSANRLAGRPFPVRWTQGLTARVIGSTVGAGPNGGRTDCGWDADRRGAARPQKPSTTPTPASSWARRWPAR